MPQRTIPEREPVGDEFSGALLQWNERHFLTVEACPGIETVATGNLVIRYGVRYQGKPHLSIVPGLVALDYGDILTGEAAFEFLLNRSNRYPRADVIGYRNDGQDEMIVVKLLDLALPLHVLVYRDAVATMPIASVMALIAPKSAAVQPRLQQHLPRYESLEEWRTDG